MLTITGDKARMERRTAADLVRRIWEGTVQVDASQSPKRIGMFSPGDNKNQLLGVYSLEGDTLKICHSKSANEYPRDFTAEAGSGQAGRRVHPRSRHVRARILSSVP